MPTVVAGRRPSARDEQSQLTNTTRGGTMADKSPRQHQSKKSGKTLKEKRRDKKVKQATKRATS
jgi:hypothetical protein